jgi:pimeloyl-ACP methyl ester carboxylesterase
VAGGTRFGDETPTLHRIDVGAQEFNVAIAGRGSPILLLHGFPHTWRLWVDVIPSLARRHRVIAPDLRGLGASSKASGGYDAGTLADDADGILDVLGESAVDVVGIDLGAPPGFLLAMRNPVRVRRLVLMEAVLGTLPGAESFASGGPPWWFGFHGVPDLAEAVLTGHEDQYITWFLNQGTLGRGVREPVRTQFVEAYTGADALRCAFSHYRAMPTSAAQIAAAAEAGRLTMPTLAIGAHPVGSALAGQLSPLTDHLTERIIDDCGHIIPLDRPEALAQLLTSFLGEVH